jgi:predicted Zn-dependent protease
MTQRFFTSLQKENPSDANLYGLSLANKNSGNFKQSIQQINILARKYPKNLFIQKYLSQSLNKIKIASGIKLEVDVDPINFS